MDIRNMERFDLDTWYKALVERVEEKQRAEREAMQQRMEEHNKKVAAERERMENLVAAVGVQMKKDRLAAIEKEKQEAAEKAQKEVDAKYGSQKNEAAWNDFVSKLLK